MRPIRFRTAFTGLAALFRATALAAISIAARAGGAHPRIGFSIDDLRRESRSRDRDFVASAKSMGTTVDVRSADGSEQR